MVANSLASPSPVSESYLVMRYISPIAWGASSLSLSRMASTALSCSSGVRSFQLLHFDPFFAWIPRESRSSKHPFGLSLTPGMDGSEAYCRYWFSGLVYLPK